MKLQRKTPHDDLTMVQSPNDWPRWPLLPMKKWNPNTRCYDCAILFADNKPTLILSGLYQLGDEEGLTFADAFNKFPKEEFESFEAMLNAGWMVD